MVNLLLTKLLQLSFAFGMFGIVMSFDASKYTNSSSLSNTYKIYWSIDSDQIFLAIQADTRGWVGFGIAEITSGSMPGSDIVTGSVSNDGTVYLQDRYATDFVTPSIDRCQDWKLIAGEMTEEGRTIIEVSRLLDTKDPQDRPIVAGLNRIVWAWGENDEVSYHDTNRGDLAFTFYGGVEQTKATGFTQDYSFDGTPVPTKITTYTARAFAFPVDRDYHIVQIDAEISNSLIHHAVLYACINDSDWIQSHLNRSSEIYTTNDHLPSNCNQVLWAWTPGMTSLVLPEVAGFKVSSVGDAFKFLVVQTHYHNPSGVLAVDNSHYTFTFTSQLRTHEAAVIQLGDPRVSLTSLIPARTDAAHYEFSCSSDCTKTWEHDITVWGSFLHMHKLGQRIYSTHFRGTTSLGPINSIEFYDRDYQQVTPVNRIIQKGDRVNTHCIYNTGNKLDATEFGLSSDEEMCIDFLFYYPKLPNRPYCSFLEGRDNKTYTMCLGTTTIDERNPTVRDGLMDVSFGIEGSCVLPGEESSHAELVMKVSVGAMFGVCLLSTVIIVGMMGGLLFIAMKTKDPSLENRHQQLDEEHH